MNIRIKATAHCSRTGCAAHFDYEFDPDDVRANIESGGSVRLEWPLPETPAGWSSESWSLLYCPDHRGPVTPGLESTP